MVYDCIVLGVGGIGSAALYAAAKKGWSVLGIDRFGAVHDRGSSHGRTRIIRTAYFEHPNYVPLARSAWNSWELLQGLGSTKLMQKTGLLQVGPESGEVIQGVLSSAREHEIAIEQMSTQDAMQRFPAFKLPNEQCAVFEEQAGFLLVENCIAQVLKLAQQESATLMSNTVAERISVDDDGTINVITSDETFRARRLVIALGSWTRELLSGLEFGIEVVRKPMFWFQIDRTDIKYQNGLPAFLIETDENCFYSIPEVDYLGMKVAEHSGGQPVADPLEVDRNCNADEQSACEAFLDQHFEFSKRRLVHHSVCMYSMSADGHFIVDSHPDCSNIVFAAGMSGHGFKFAPVIGERLVEMLDSQANEDFDFLRMGNRQLV